MNNYDICGLLVGMEPDGITQRQAEKYLSNINSEPDMIVKPLKKEDYDSKTRYYPFEQYQYLTCGVDFYRKLLDFNGIMLHASAVVVDDGAYLFSAASGTGKSTHTQLWLELFGERAFILNDDKPAIRIIDNAIYAYGTPWSGKYDISVNKAVRLKGICFLNRGKSNKIERLDFQTAVIRLYHGTLKKLDANQTQKSFDIIEQIVKGIPVYEMFCTPDIEAAKIAFNTMKDN